MTTYDKPKRKNAPQPQTSIFYMLTSLVSGLVYYGFIAPIRWTWRQCARFIKWNWQQVMRFGGWIGSQIGKIFGGIWWLTRTLIEKTIFAPIIGVGRLLGFVPNAIPAGLSPQEAEVYQRINRQYRRQKRWYLHIISFLIGMVILWVSEFSTWSEWYQPRIGMLVIITLVWLLILGTHRLWMNLGKSEDHEIGNALQQLRQSQQSVYYEEEIYEDRPYDATRLEDQYEQESQWDEELLHQATKAKRGG